MITMLQHVAVAAVAATTIAPLSTAHPQNASASFSYTAGTVMVSAPHLRTSQSTVPNNYSVSMTVNSSIADTPILIDLPSDVTIRDGLSGGAYAVKNDKEFAFGISAPEITTASGSTVSGVIKRDSNRKLTVEPTRPLSMKDYPLTVNATFGITLIDWVNRSSFEGQPRYEIHPTNVGRVTPIPILASAGWSQAQARGGFSSTPSLYNQYICHPMSEIARGKSTWNIEAARPDVGLARTIAAKCNPGQAGD